MNTLFSQLRTEVKTTYDITDKPFDIPVLPKAQCIVIPVIREAIAPLIIRNNDADMITDIELANELRVRMIASKTKGVERRRGSQILRTFGLGGRAAANKAYVKDKPSDVFDLNTFVFGDSATGGKSKKSIYPVHAAVLYSDAITVQPYDLLIDDVFRQGGISEEYVSYDPENQKTSSNIFTTRSVRPGALFIQTLVMLGHRITKESFNHLLLSIGLAGSYGGATATTGTNLKTHLAGVYWGKIERSINAPSQLLEQLKSDTSVADLVKQIAQLMQDAYPHHIGVEELNAHVRKLIADFESVNPELKNDYEKAAKEMGELFDAWFKQDTKKKTR